MDSFLPKKLILLASMIKNTSYFMLKVLFVLEIFKLLFSLFGYIEKRLDKKAKVSFKIYGVTD